MIEATNSSLDRSLRDKERAEVRCAGVLLDITQDILDKTPGDVDALPRLHRYDVAIGWLEFALRNLWV